MDHTLLGLLLICIVVALSLLNRRSRVDTEEESDTMKVSARGRQPGSNGRAAVVPGSGDRIIEPARFQIAEGRHAVRREDKAESLEPTR